MEQGILFLGHGDDSLLTALLSHSQGRRDVKKLKIRLTGHWTPAAIPAGRVLVCLCSEKITFVESFEVSASRTY